jgi:putative ATPase
MSIPSAPANSWADTPVQSSPPTESPVESTLPLLDKEPARPLADRLRAAQLDEVVGQVHLLAPDAPLGRMVAQQRLGPAIL